LPFLAECKDYIMSMPPMPPPPGIAGAPDSFWAAIGRSAADFPALTWGNFLAGNLLPVTITEPAGNVLEARVGTPQGRGHRQDQRLGRVPA
jgi:hypothetical protein